VKPIKSTKMESSNFSICELENDAIIMSAFKRSDKDEDSFIIRVVNMSSENQKSKIKLMIPIEKISIVNLNEEEITSDVKPEILKSNLENGVIIQKIESNSFEFEIKPNIIGTFKIKPKL